MAYQRGSLKQFKRKEGMTWVLRYRTITAEGRRVENGMTVGLVRNFPKEQDAWREVDKLGLLVRINNDDNTGTRITFATLAEHYLASDMGENAVRPKSDNTIPIVRHYVRDYLVKRWGTDLADEIKPLAVQQWLLSLRNDKGLAWTTVSKIRQIMNRVYKVGLLHERVTRNPVANVETRCTTNYRAVTLSPKQTLDILEKLYNPLHYALVLTCAATALRSSELVALRWNDVRWDEGRIRISKRYAKGRDGETKTRASDGFVPLHPILAAELGAWQAQTPYGKLEDFIFPSFQKDGKVPVWASTFVQDHLRPAAIASGVQLQPSQRFGLHNLRHSLSNWLVNKGKIQAKTVQGLLRHANIKTTLDLYTQEDNEETREAQGAFLGAMGLGSRLAE
jgi:integrase